LNRSGFGLTANCQRNDGRATFRAPLCRSVIDGVLVASRITSFKTMSRRHSNLAIQLEAGLGNSEFRRSLATKLDMSLKRSKVSSSRVASLLRVAESDVILWRAGASVPNSAECHRLADMLGIDVAWLCGCDEANPRE
jgi:hypothetical protein